LKDYKDREKMFYADNCQVRETYEPEHTYTFTGPCVVTGKEYSVTVKAESLNKYRRGAFLQEAFKELSRDDREFLMSGISPEGWDKTFGEDDECC